MEMKKHELINIVIAKVLKSMRVSYEEFMSKKRIRQFAYAKHFASKALKELLPQYGQYISFNEVGNLTGGRDHASAIHSIKTASNLVETDKSYRKYYNNLVLTINNEIEKIQLSDHLGLPYRGRDVQIHLANKIAREFSFRRTVRVAREHFGMVQPIRPRSFQGVKQVSSIRLESRQYSSGKTSGAYMDRSRQLR